MKKISTISLFIFGVVVTAILVAGLVFYQNGKNGAINKPVNVAADTISKNSTTGKLTLNMEEIAKHNNKNDCWMLISGNVYNITSFFGSHPGGNRVMEKTCGTDATDAYLTKDPNANTTTGGQDHSARAREMLKDYYLGALNQTIQ